MNRGEFTKGIAGLLIQMWNEGEYPIADFLKRSPEEQNRLFKLGKSNADGINTHSQHEFGKALDILFLDLDDADKDGITQELKVSPKKGWDYWHKEWEKKGGKAMTEWYQKNDQGHFEG
jgi:hypothetical protein